MRASTTVELVQPTEHPQVLAAGEVLVDRRVLTGQADDGTQLLRLLDHVEAGHCRVPCIRTEQGGQDAHRGRLAGAVGAQQAQHAAFRDRQVDTIERPDLGLARLVDLDQALGRDDVQDASIVMRVSIGNLQVRLGSSL